MGRKPIIVFTILCFAFIAFTPARAEDDARIRELFRKSGVEAAIYALPGALRAGGAQTHGKGAPHDRFDRAFDEAAQTAYNPDRVFNRMVEVFRGLLPPAYLRAVTLHYNSPLGRRITRMETASFRASPGEKIAYIREAMANRERFDRRAALCRKVDAASHTTELGVTLAIHTLIAFQSALLKAGMLHSDMNWAELKSRIEGRRPALRRQAAHGNLISFLFAYRELSSGELRQYLRFLQSRAGRKLVMATSATFDAVLTERAVVFGGELVKNLKTLPL